MGYAKETGYTPQSITEIMSALRVNINAQFGTSYTVDNFEGTNFYKYFYALAQRMQENEVKTSEIFLKLQNYFIETNATISRPVVTSPGIVEKLGTEGYIASVKPMIAADAGKISICVDTDETDPAYSTTKLAINTLISQICVGGAVTQGTETSAIVLSNGQSFNFKFNLPNRIPVGLKLTTTLSVNNQVVVGDPDATKVKLLSQVAARYRLGKNFEPQKYFSLSDAPWCSDVKLEWTSDVTGGVVDVGATYHTSIYSANYNDLFVVDLARVLLVEV